MMPALSVGALLGATWRGLWAPHPRSHDGHGRRGASRPPRALPRWPRCCCRRRRSGGPPRPTAALAVLPAYLLKRGRGRIQPRRHGPQGPQAPQKAAAPRMGQSQDQPPIGMARAQRTQRATNPMRPKDEARKEE
ncbi:MAG: hypothetical protein ACLSVD_15035 [Eggerthellaceae bacterium]